MKLLRNVISVLSVYVDKVSWNVEGIDTEENLNPAVNIDFRPIDISKNTIKSFTDFSFGNKGKIYFACKVEVLVITPNFDFDQIMNNPEHRKLVMDVCAEMAMGHIRNMLIYATSMAGLGTPILLNGVVPIALVPGGFQESGTEETQQTSEG
ncbi:hypothetical protein [Deinococcus frigens]|uniref:hypothetical protein n=1 Tax=Deinococcus frigens TaxID=249403 RepID=UPI0012ECB191|nr:hypothetical protein [Deinococcus frigens]